MNKLFKYANSIWVRYSDYVITETSDGIKYLQPAPNAVPKPYDPVEEFENIALDAVSVGQLCMSQEATDSEKQEAIRGFALKYGLLGIMTAIPTTPKFLPYENVIFPKNHFIREESMPVEKYLDVFSVNMQRDWIGWKSSLRTGHSISWLYSFIMKIRMDLQKSRKSSTSRVWRRLMG